MQPCTQIFQMKITDADDIQLEHQQSKQLYS